jgi:hypothetical protein
VLLIRRLACSECGKKHHELPDILVPYKRHCAATVENIITDGEDSACCEESTIRRIRQWWQIMYLYFKGICNAQTVKHGINFGEPLQLVETVRAVGNSHNWASTRSAFSSG